MSIDLSKVGVKTAIKIMIAETDTKSIAELAKKISIKDTTLRSAINNNAVRVSDFLDIAEALGYTVEVSRKED